METTDYRGSDVRLCADGKYRWVYEMGMFTNPTIFWTVLKVLGGVWIAIWIVEVLVRGFEDFLPSLKVFAIVMAVIVVISFLGYLVVAIMYGGKYVVLFEMDEKEVSHIQMPRQYKKAQVMGWITAMAGLSSGSLSTAGAGMLAASKNSSTSVLANVRKVKAYRRRHLIKVNQLLNKNQVYASDADFDFVYNFLKSYCPNA